MNRRSLRALVLLVLLPLAACGGEPSDEGPRLVLLYATCTLNKRFLEPYDPEVDYTPSLARFAREAAVLANHQTESGISGTAYASILTGTQADRHGVFEHPQRLDRDLTLVFERFASAGYQTFHWNRHPMTHPRWNYSQGVVRPNILLRDLRAGDPRWRALLERLAEEPVARAFVATTFTVTHGPYPADHLEAFARAHPEALGSMSVAEVRRHHALYAENHRRLSTRFDETVASLGLSEREVAELAEAVEILYASRVHLLDRRFGELLESIERAGLEDESLVAFTADHGETLYRPERPYPWTHGPDLAPEVIGVPFLVRSEAAGVEPARIDAVSRSIDVLPTLAGLAGLPAPEREGPDGVDLAPALRGERAFPELRAYAHGTLRLWAFPEPGTIDRIRVALKDGARFARGRREGSRWRFALFDPAPSGALGPNLFDPDEPAQRRSAEALRGYRERMVGAYRRQHGEAPPSKEEARRSLSEEQEEALRSLGYIE